MKTYRKWLWLLAVIPVITLVMLFIKGGIVTSETSEEYFYLTPEELSLLKKDALENQNETAAWRMFFYFSSRHDYVESEKWEQIAEEIRLVRDGVIHQQDSDGEKSPEDDAESGADVGSEEITQPENQAGNE